MPLELQPISPGQEELVQAVIESDPGYAERVTGLPPGPADATSLLLGQPPDLDPDDKVVLGIWDGPDLVGVIDLLRGHPVRGTAYLGLLLVRRDRQGQGVGREAHHLLVAGLADWPEITTLRLAVVASNGERVREFWRSLGYVEVGEPVPWTYGSSFASTAQRFERPVTRSVTRPAP